MPKLMHSKSPPKPHVKKKPSASEKVISKKVATSVAITHELADELIIVQDRELIESMWKDIWKVWFPLGKTDPCIALLKFTAHEGEFWDNAGMQAIKYVYSAAKALIAGTRPEADKERHSKVTLK